MFEPIIMTFVGLAAIVLAGSAVVLPPLLVYWWDLFDISKEGFAVTAVVFYFSMFAAIGTVGFCYLVGLVVVDWLPHLSTTTTAPQYSLWLIATVVMAVVAVCLFIYSPPEEHRP